ncbi:alpha/beta fold hydrolase [Hathewaya massiliensis]|uniref:alpha/beta fold hydrolase n=1 Tax=Hathewaya massiliensis TaxID=1964382 RepID=UPI00115BC904|nr:alpha/beta fold hydrolase [Hathewaya massiliensis]
MEQYIDIDHGKLYVKILGQGEPILFIHGGPGLCHNYFLPYLEALSENNMLIFYDQRGNGKSYFKLQDESNLSIEEFIEDIERIRKALFLDKINIFAHSMGGFFAINYALKYGEKLDKLVLSNSIPLNFEDFEKMNIIKKSKIHPVDFSRLLQLQQMKEFKEYDEDIFYEYISILEKSSFIHEENCKNITSSLEFNKDNYENFLKINVKVISEYMYNIKFKSLNLKNIKSKTLLLYGIQDFIPYSSFEYFKNNISNCNIEFMDKSGHYPFIEENRKTISILSGFFQ